MPPPAAGPRSLPAVPRPVAILIAVVVATGLLLGGAFIFFRGADTAPPGCQPDPEGWNGQGGGGTHAASGNTAARAQGAGWAPAWETPRPAADADRLTAPPSAASGLVYTVSGRGELVALAAGTGGEAWRSAAAGAAGPGTLPVALDGCAAVVSTPESGGGAVRAVVLATHRQQWSHAVPDARGAAPALDTHTVYAGVSDPGSAGAGSGLVALALADGSVRIRIPLGGTVVGSVAVGGGRLYAAASDGSLTAFGVDPAAATATVLWTVMPGSPAAGGPVIVPEGVLVGLMDGSLRLYNPDGRLSWRADAGGPLVVAPARGRTLIAGASADGRVTALDTRGSVRWTRRLTGVVTGLALAGDSVVVATADGMLRELDPEGGADLSSWHSDTPLVGAPALYAGRVLITTADGRVASLPI